MAWPTVAVVTTGMDQDTDDLPRAAILDLTTKFNDAIAMWGVANGVCDLDASTLVPVARIPAAIARLANAALTGTTSVTLLNEAVGIDIASAATINLTTATGNLTHITGNVSITAVTLGAGMRRTVIFDGVLSLVHHTTSNNLPGGQPITTSAGDRAVYWSDGTTVYCIVFSRANGAAVTGSGGVGSAIVNNTATVASPLVMTSATHNTHIVRTTDTSTERVFTFPAATSNSGMYLWIDNASANDGSPGVSGLRLLSNGGTIGGCAAAGTINYIPAYTVIGFQSDGTNWPVFEYSGKTIWTFTANGTWYCPPGKTSGVGTVIAEGGHGYDSGGGLSSGASSSIGALLSAAGGGSGTTTASGVGGSPNGQRGSDAALMGGSTPYGQGGVVYTSAGKATGYGSGGCADSAVGFPGGGAGWRLKESITPVPGTAYAITIGNSNPGSTREGRPGIAIVELN